jgi:hypothetical protein
MVKETVRSVKGGTDHWFHFLRKYIPSLKSVPRSFRRMLISTVVLTLLYITLNELWVGVFMAGHSRGFLPNFGESNLADEAKKIAAASAAGAAKLTPEHRLAAWYLGGNIGYVSQILSVFALSDTTDQQRVRAEMASSLTTAKRAADFLQVGPATALESRTWAELFNLGAHIEADETGLATRIAERVSPQHKELFMLGMYVGMQMATLDLDLKLHANRSQLALPSLEIKRHATLAGLSRAEWEPLAKLPECNTPEELTTTYRNTVVAADSAIRKADIEH